MNGKTIIVVVAALFTSELIAAEWLRATVSGITAEVFQYKESDLLLVQLHYKLRVSNPTTKSVLLPVESNDFVSLEWAVIEAGQIRMQLKPGGQFMRDPEGHFSDCTKLHPGETRDIHVRADSSIVFSIDIADLRPEATLRLAFSPICRTRTRPLRDTFPGVHHTQFSAAPVRVRIPPTPVR